MVEEQHKNLCRKFELNATSEDLQAAFGEFNVTAADVVLDRISGRSRGFGFVTVASAEDLGARREAYERM